VRGSAAKPVNLNDLQGIEELAEAMPNTAAAPRRVGYITAALKTACLIDQALKNAQKAVQSDE